MRRTIAAAGAAFLAGWLAQAPAQVRITKGLGDSATLDLSAFVGQSAGAPALFRQTLEADLVRSGWFNLAGAGRAEYSVQGEAGLAGQTLEVRCEVNNVAARERLLGKTYRAPAEQARRLAHKAADDIVRAITGRAGMAGARLLLVGTRTGHKEIYTCDADGLNLRQWTRDGSISLAPKWSADGRFFVYTSFRSQFPDVYRVTTGTGARTRLAGFPGLNAGAAVSPDGSKVALILSKDGNPELYVMPTNKGRLVRLTETRRAAEASPSWSPDGRQIVYVSDSPGTPQLFLVDSAGGAPRRLTSRGSQNVDPDWGANGFIACSSYTGGRYQIAVIHPSTLDQRLVSGADADYEDPSWAPDGRHIFCTRTERYRSRIFMIDTLTGSGLPLLSESEAGDWSAPDCSKASFAD